MDTSQQFLSLFTISVTTCGPAPVFPQTTRVLTNGGKRATYRCGGSFNNSLLAGSDYTLECSSPDPENLPAEWRPTAAAALLCTAGTVHARSLKIVYFVVLEVF